MNRIDLGTGYFIEIFDVESTCFSRWDELVQKGIPTMYAGNVNTMPYLSLKKCFKYSTLIGYYIPNYDDFHSYDSIKNLINAVSTGRYCIVYKSSDEITDLSDETTHVEDVKSIIAYIDTPIGRRKYPEEVLNIVNKFKEWLKENK